MNDNNLTNIVTLIARQILFRFVLNKFERYEICAQQNKMELSMEGNWDTYTTTCIAVSSAMHCRIVINGDEAEDKIFNR